MKVGFPSELKIKNPGGGGGSELLSATLGIWYLRIWVRFRVWGSGFSLDVGCRVRFKVWGLGVRVA